jgi:hypothetical protein
MDSYQQTYSNLSLVNSVTEDIKKIGNIISIKPYSLHSIDTVLTDLMFTNINPKILFISQTAILFNTELATRQIIFNRIIAGVNREFYYIQATSNTSTFPGFTTYFHNIEYSVDPINNDTSFIFIGFIVELE